MVLWVGVRQLLQRRQVVVYLFRLAQFFEHIRVPLLHQCHLCISLFIMGYREPPSPPPGNRRVAPDHTLVGACLSTQLGRASRSPSPRSAGSVYPKPRRGCSGARIPIPRAHLLGAALDLALSPPK